MLSSGLGSIWHLDLAGFDVLPGLTKMATTQRIEQMLCPHSGQFDDFLQKSAENS